MENTSREGHMRSSIDPDPHPPHAFTHSYSTPSNVAPTIVVVDELEGFEPKQDAIVYVITSPSSSSSIGDEFDD